MSKELNVLIWAPFGCGLSYWGPGISAFRLYQGLQPSDNVNLYLAHGFKDQQEYKEYKNQFFISDLSRFGPLGAIWFLLKSYFWISRNYKKFDVVHVLSVYHLFFLPALWFEKKGVPTAMLIPNAESGFVNSSITSRLLGLRKFRLNNINKVSKYISISTSIRAELEGYGVHKDRIVDIPFGINIHRFKPVDKSEKAHLKNELGFNNDLLLISAGEITQRKYQKLLIEALVASEEKYFNVLLVGPRGKVLDQSEEILNMVKSHGLVDRFKWIPFTPDIHKLYQAADIFVLPSNNEGLANAMLESMACGLPALVTPISGAVDVVREGETGFFIERNIGSLLKILDSLKGDMEEVNRLGKNASIFINNYCSQTLVLEKHLKLFSELRRK